ncbi:MAG: hypothetical protein DSZ28_08140 [Thiothrix sp.]|nr:MAG: hypothetical protein DSZ28_08140 [Thiothrix sp.]
MKKSVQKIVGSVVLLIAVVGYQSFIESKVPPEDSLSGSATEASAQVDTKQSRAGLNQLMGAFKSHTSKLWLEVTGTVSKSLRDDTKGDRHQKFILKLANGHTVLVAHNIDLAAKVPLKEGDNVAIRARYEWSKQGGVLHWTHRDPRMHIEGGWIQHSGKKYR